MVETLVIALESTVNCINLFLLAIILQTLQCASYFLWPPFGFLSSGYGLKGILIGRSGSGP